MRNVKKLNEQDLRNGIFEHTKTWHSQYKDSAYIFIGNEYTFCFTHHSQKDVLLILGYFLLYYTFLYKQPRFPVQARAGVANPGVKLLLRLLIILYNKWAI